MNVHATAVDRSDDKMNKFYEELERVLDQFPNYNMKILLGDFNAKAGREYIFKPTIRNENLHEVNNNNGFTVVKFATSNNLILKRTVFTQRNIHKNTLISPD
jgi:hypothetical protein